MLFTSFCREQGVNRKFEHHFKRFEEDLFRRPKDPEALRQLYEPIDDEDYFCELVAIYSSRSDKGIK